MTSRRAVIAIGTALITLAAIHAAGGGACQRPIHVYVISKGALVPQGEP